jgi:processive 1,2-diacylglycerol beta-glucosyltransferase
MGAISKKSNTKFNLMSKKVLIFHTSIGLGHKFIAENIGWQLSQAGCEVRVADVLEVQKGKLVELSTKIHHWMNTSAPWLWSFLYHVTNLSLVVKSTLPIRLWVAKKNCSKTLGLINEFQPDMVISVHNTASAILAHLKKEKLYEGLFVIGFSDFHLHKFWLFNQADFYLANIAEQKQEMIDWGINPNKVAVCGITLKPKLNINSNAVKQKLGLAAEERVILVGSGSLGIGFSEQLLGQLFALPKTKVIVVTGKNEKYKNYLNEKYAKENLLTLGFYEPMAELYAIADVFFSKPGGLSTSEALQYGLSIIVPYVLPGQEELNLKYLLSKNLVQKISPKLISQISGIKSFQESLYENPSFQAIVYPKVSAVSAVINLFK